MPHVFAPKLTLPKIFFMYNIGTRDVRIQALYQYRGQGQSANTYFKNNSLKIFSCIRTSANTGPTCIRAKINSSRFFSCMYRFCAGGTTPIACTLPAVCFLTIQTRPATILTVSSPQHSFSGYHPGRHDYKIIP